MKIWFKHKATEVVIEVKPWLLRLALSLLIRDDESIHSFIDFLPW